MLGKISCLIAFVQFETFFIALTVYHHFKGIYVNEFFSHFLSSSAEIVLHFPHCAVLLDIYTIFFSTCRASVDRFSEKEFEENFLRVVCPIFE